MVFKVLRDEIDGAIARDPAARSRLEVFLFYPSVHAILAYRASHALWKRDFRLLARGLSQFSRFMTGIEIHPGAKIGQRLFIDHGMGLVIGETAAIGDDVTLYHDVTLGGVAPAVNARAQVDVKRHPTVEDGAIIGSGAQILGPIVVGAGASVGANAVVVKSVPAGATVVGNPARVVERRRSEDGGAVGRNFRAYGTPTDDLPDPVARALDALLNQVESLKARVAELEADRGRSISSDRIEGEDAEQDGQSEIGRASN